MYSKNDILSPFTLPNGTQLKNRLLMAPMTTCTGYFDGSVTSELVEYYRERALFPLCVGEYFHSAK